MIPAWDMSGVLPPIRPGKDGSSAERSPYCVPLTEVVGRFSSSKPRTTILTGLLDFRAALHQAGISRGFQWLDGSFLEKTETQESRPPNDVDVVTFFHLPNGETQLTLKQKEAELFDHEHLKTTFSVDAYWLPLGEEIESRNVRQICYWHSMWSHKRNGVWKGYVQIDLDPKEDSTAKHILEASRMGS